MLAHPGAKKCEICGGAASHYFFKTFNAFALEDVDYWQCGVCGFVLSRTHAEMSPAPWSELNRLCHEQYQGTDSNALDPRWKARIAAQARALSDLARVGLIDRSQRWVDFGCGDGILSDTAAADHGLSLLKYDEYMATDDGYLPTDALTKGGFDFVISTSVFEHMTRRDQWDGVNALVARSGALGVHTLVTETVPRDPTWFYLQPPHCAFFTNAAMAHLFEDWGYSASIYSVAASLWVWFRSDPDEVERKVARFNQTAADPILFKAGFLDYWKGDPRR
jgi:hypothetical protein